MELFGIVLSIPAAFVASGVYRFLLLLVRSYWAHITSIFLPPSYLVLTAVLVEWVLLAARGAVGVRILIGSAYYPIHSLIFLLGTPALANALVLPDPSRRPAAWWAVLPACTVLAFVLVLQQYAVSEAPYGIDDGTGPFSKIDRWW